MQAVGCLTEEGLRPISSLEKRTRFLLRWSARTGVSASKISLPTGSVELPHVTRLYVAMGTSNTGLPTWQPERLS